MISYQEAYNTLHTRQVSFTLQEYLFVLQVVLGEDAAVAYASVYDSEFNRNIPSENEEKYLNQFKNKAYTLLEQQSCRHLKDYLEQEYQSDIQQQASNLENYKFTGADIQQILANLLHNRVGDGSTLDDASVKDVIQLIKSMYDSGALDSGDAFEKHFVIVPRKFNALCPSCNHEMSVVEGLSVVCEFCGQHILWDENSRRYYPEVGHL